MAYTSEASTSEVHTIKKPGSVNYVSRSNQNRRNSKTSDRKSRPKNGDCQTRICGFCGYDRIRAHSKGKHPANGKSCNLFKKKHHFANSSVCPGPNKGNIVKKGDSTSSLEKDGIARRILEANRIPKENADNKEK